MPKQIIPTILGDRIETGDYRDALPENLYTVKRTVRGSEGYLINQPGLVEFGETTGTDRGGYYSTRFSTHFRITGTDLLSIDSEGNTTILGTIPGSLQVQMAESFNNFAVLASGRLFYYNPNDGFREITDPNLGSPIDICFIAGYFFFTDGENLYHTTISDEEVINPLDFATAELSPDPTIAVNRTAENQVLVADRHTLSWFYVSGGENFAFTPINGKSVKAGPVATQLIAEIKGSWFMVGGRKEESIFIYQIAGGGISKISTREIDKILSEYTEEELKTASIEARAQDGYYFLHINLPNDTLLFNLTIAESLGPQYAWTKLKSSVVGGSGWVGINGVFDPKIGMWIYGDRTASRVGVLDKSVSTQYGEKQEFLFYTPFVYLDGKSVNQVELKTISGFSNTKQTVSLSITMDGQTYGKEYFSTYSEKNNRNLRFELRRIGSSDDYMGFKVRAVTDALLNFGAMELDYD